MSNVVLIGAGPGGKDYILPIAKKAADRCHTLVLMEHQRDLFDDHPNIIVEKDADTIIELAKENLDRGDVGIVLSGDPTFYSLMNLLKRGIPGVEFEVIPGVGSMQVLAARLQEAYDGQKVLSVIKSSVAPHDVATAIQSNRDTLVLFGREHDPKWFCQVLLDNGLDDVEIAIGDELSFDSEKVVSGTPAEVQDVVFSDLCVGRVRNRSVGGL